MALSAAQRSTMLMMTPPNTDGCFRPFAWWGIIRSATTASDPRGVLGRSWGEAAACGAALVVMLGPGKRCAPIAPAMDDAPPDGAGCYGGAGRGRDGTRRCGPRRH